MSLENTAVEPPEDPLPPLPWATRAVLLVLGWILVLVGIVGLALPAIQGILTLMLGCAVLSLSSRGAYRILERLLRRWPKLWSRMERFRARVYHFLAGKASGAGDDAGQDQDRSDTGT